MNKFYPPKPGSTLPARGTNAVADKTQPPTLSGSPTVPKLSASTAGVAARPAASAHEVIEVLEVEGTRYHVTSHGGGLKLIELTSYPASVSTGKGQDSVTNRWATLNTKAPVPALTILGGEAIEGDGLFSLRRQGDGVVAEKQWPGGLLLTKEFRPGSNGLVSVTVRFENRGAQPLLLPAQEWVMGTATPASVHDDASLMGLQWYDGSSVTRIGSTWFDNRTLGCLPSAPRQVYEAGAGATGSVSWVAVHNQFFTIAAMPREPLKNLVARRVDLPGPTETEAAADPKAVARPFGFQTAFLVEGQSLAAGQSVERHFDLYAGGKKYNTLAKLASIRGNNLDYVMNFDGFFGFFAKALLLGMNALAALGLPYALAIIAITVIIKLIFWPLTQASTRSMKRMSALQPQMKAIQERYKDDAQKMNQKLMEFMKENKVNPVGGCLPMLIQIPVFFGFFTMIRSAIELRGASFLWAHDLSQPDTLFVIPGLNMPFNLLPLIMTATTLWQTHLTPPSPGMDPVQQKIMRYMPLMFIVILYNFQSGLTLYWTTQNLLTIAQMKLTRDSGNTPSATPAAGGGKAGPSVRRKV